MKKLFKYVKEYKFHTIMAPFLIFCEVIVETLIPTVAGKGLIDDGVKAGDINLIIKYGLILIGLTLLALTFGIISRKNGSNCFYRFC